MEATKTIKRGVYVCFVGSKQTRATYRKSEALKFARRTPGAEVYGMNRAQWRDSGPFGWDGPTFRICADLIFRESDRVRPSDDGLLRSLGV